MQVCNILKKCYNINSFFGSFRYLLIKKNMEKSVLVKKSKEIFGDVYDFSLVPEIFKTKEKLSIICPQHGVFYKSYEKHIGGKQGCPECAGKKRYNTESFIEKVKTLEHVTDYTFEKINYVNNKTKVTVTCKIHGDFEITPGHLLSGEGCPKCRYIKSANNKRRCLEEVINIANEVHDYKYDYSLIKEYKNDRIKYPIICSEHGKFMQTFNNHIKGKQGCPTCGRKQCDKKRTNTFDEFVNKARLVHGDAYEYNDNEYVRTNCKIGITCKKHGAFYMTPANHLQGQQCPKCASSHSKGEDDLFKFICSLINEKVVQRDRETLNGTELDIIIPNRNIAFEYNGLHWHSELLKERNYHLIKTKECENKNIRLFHIFEDEWNTKRDILESMIKNLLGITENKIYARKCLIKEVNSKDALIFLENNHLQGRCNSTYRYGLYYDNELVSLMTFGKSRHFVGNKKYEWELLRFCNKQNTNVIGAASKLFKHFIETINPNSVVSYADRRWSNGNLYDKIGFTKYNESLPNYYYIIGNKRYYRFNFRKSILVKKYNCPQDMSEHEFCLSQKWYRIYDCGCLCYKWEKNN